MIVVHKTRAGEGGKRPVFKYEGRGRGCVQIRGQGKGVCSNTRVHYYSLWEESVHPDFKQVGHFCNLY